MVHGWGADLHLRSQYRKPHRGQAAYRVAGRGGADALAAAAIAPGDSFTVSAGCDKYFATCRDKFANALNFRGFPQMPGNDHVLSYPAQGDPALDGGSLHR